MQPVNPRTFAIAVLAVLIMSIIPVLIRSMEANVITIGLGRLGVTVFFISLFLLYKGGLRRGGMSTGNWLGLGVIGIVFGLHWLTYFLAIKLSSAAIGVIGVSTFGIHLLILNWLVNGQKITLFELAAIAICFVGCLLVIPEFSLSNTSTVGLLIGVVSGFLYACLPLLHQRSNTLPTSIRAWGQFTFALLVFLPFAGQSHWQMTSADWIKLLVLGVLCTLVAHSLWVKASTELPGIITGLVYYLYIPIAVILGAIFLGERITPAMVVGGTLIFAANLGQTVYSWKVHVQRTGR